jgi:hypothetical protein
MIDKIITTSYLFLVLQQLPFYFPKIKLALANKIFQLNLIYLFSHYTIQLLLSNTLLTTITLLEYLLSTT